jgi:putative MATE family efflux protein
MRRSRAFESLSQRLPQALLRLPFSRAVWALSLPLIFAEVSETLIHVIGTVFLTRVGVVEVGAVALADTVFELFAVLTFGLVDGLQILIARRIGQGRDRSVGETFNQGLGLLITISILLTALLFWLARPLSTLLVSSEDVGIAVAQFLRIIAFAIGFNAISLAYSALFVALGQTRVLIWATLVLAITNIAMDYTLVFGHFGFPALGIEGAAIGSLGAEIATCVFLTFHILLRCDCARYGLFRFSKWQGGITKLLARLSWPIALEALLEAGRWLVFFLIIERISPLALAESNLVYACFEVFLIPTGGFAETACSTVSNWVGQGRTRFGSLVREVTAASYVITLPLALFVLLFPGVVLSLLDIEGALKGGGEASLRVLSLAMLIVIPAEMWAAAVIGTGDTFASFWIEAALTVVMIGGALLAGSVLHLPLYYVWMSVPIGWLACWVLSYLWMRSGQWKVAGEI